MWLTICPSVSLVRHTTLKMFVKFSHSTTHQLRNGEDYPEVYFNVTSLSFFAPRLEKCIFHLYGKLN